LRNLPYIYKLTDTLNGKVYIGQHNGKSKKYFTSGKIPKKIIKKHGRKVFTREIIVQGNFNQELLNQLEIHYIRLYKSCVNWGDFGYNLTEGGGGKVGTIMSRETREKISKANKGMFVGENHPMYGKTHTDEFKLKMSILHKTRKRSKESCKRISESQIGKKLSEETKKKISEAHKGKRLSNEHKCKLSIIIKNLPKKQCPYCERYFYARNYAQHHGDKCKLKK
tara:strand:+ start:499 stop:1170 length:672 start_codon:yes stop_codon:yes gene_type:complete